MKKACISFICLAIIILPMVAFYFKGEAEPKKEYLRIHIRANSNLEADQSIKYEIKDLVVAYFTPLVKSIKTKAQAKAVFEKEKSNVNGLIDGFLRSKGFEYTANTVIDNEYFPTRMYEDLTLDAGYYDAVVIRLGKAEGDNWWCVVYPPLCFTGEGVTYKSIVYEYLRKFF